MADTGFDMIIIGSGPGGYVTAIRAAQLGFKTAIVEREHLGGICLNWGCIPTKALLRSAEIYHYMQHAKDYGLSADNVTFDPAAVVQRSRAVSGRLNRGVTVCSRRTRCRSSGARPRSPSRAKSSCAKSPSPPCSRSIPAPKGTLAPAPTRPSTSSSPPVQRPRVLPGLEPDGKLVWTYFEAMVPPEMPKSLLVVGSGAIGIEFASFYNAMGVDVTVVEIVDQIMPVEDAEIAKVAQKQLEKHGMKIKTGAKVSALKKAADSVTATIEQGGDEIRTDRRPGHLRRRRRRQYREPGPRGAGRQDREGLHRHRWLRPHQCAGRLCHRRCGRPAHAGAQGRA